MSRTVSRLILVHNPKDFVTYKLSSPVFIDTVGDPDFYKSRWCSFWYYFNFLVTLYPLSYCRLIQGLGSDYGNFTIEKKADATYKVVSAASIVAKVQLINVFHLYFNHSIYLSSILSSVLQVTRDAILSNWVWTENSVNLDKHFGSGYPGDPACVEWLKNAQNKV